MSEINREGISRLGNKGRRFAAAPAARPDAPVPDDGTVLTTRDVTDAPSSRWDTKASGRSYRLYNSIADIGFVMPTHVRRRNRIQQHGRHGHAAEPGAEDLSRCKCPCQGRSADVLETAPLQSPDMQVCGHRGLYHRGAVR